LNALNTICKEDENKKKVKSVPKIAIDLSLQSKIEKISTSMQNKQEPVFKNIKQLFGN